MKPVLLVIRDGWGENHSGAQDAYNAVKLANSPCSRDLSTNWPRTELMACGLDVGLLAGVMGNSEVGHQNIGAGRIVDQELVRLDKALFADTMKDNSVWKAALENVKQTGSTLHLMGLMSDAGVHSKIEHAIRLWELAAQAGINKIAVHAFLDGRDTPPTSGVAFVKRLEEAAKRIGVGGVASICGRYYAMDRDKRWDRVEKAYNMLVGAGRISALTASAAVEAYYENPSAQGLVGDEFVEPLLLKDSSGAAHPIKNGGSVVFFNFRGDRPRELCRAFIDANFTGFKRPEKLDLFFATLTEYEVGLSEHVLFLKPPKMEHILSEVLSAAGLRQFRTAETEKYPHVTFFFNDYRDESFPGEDRVLVPSPRDVATYDERPEMSAAGVAAAAKEAILSGKYAFVLVNFANADMVGHSGSLPATIKACEAVDKGLSELLAAVDQVEGSAIITADHGNADQMYDPLTHGPHTRHTLNPVECVLYGKGLEGAKLRPAGRLADVAPTVLHLLGLAQPTEMTGESLLA